jgi:hypothetical protein
MAVAYALAMSLIITPAGFYFAHRNSEVRLAPVLKDLIHPLFATALMVISVLLAKYVTFRLNVPGLASFVIELIVAVTAYGTLCRDRIRDLWHGDSLEPQLAVDNAAASA